MKNILTNLMTSAVLLFTIGGGLRAQSIRLHATVPFAWQVNGHQMKAGDYSIARDASAPVMLIRDRATGNGAYVLIKTEWGKSSVSRLVFHRYGEQYFLAEVDAPGASVRRLPVSRAEKEAMQAELPGQVATIFVDVRPVLN